MESDRTGVTGITQIDFMITVPVHGELAILTESQLFTPSPPNHQTNPTGIPGVSNRGCSPLALNLSKRSARGNFKIS